ncbi:MAG: glycoside hydrolase 43 family protein [Prevotella sp.]|jgi:beta-xylosidase
MHISLFRRLTIILLLQSVMAAGQVVCHNPMIWADVPDPDVIRVNDTFYLVSTTMHLMPGAPIMESKDLTHWRTTNYIFDKLTDSPKYDMKGGTVYGRGQWATSLKYHNGKFYALFAPNDNPGGDTYIYTANHARDKWTLVSRLPHFHDASLFFDDDGRVYVLHGTGQCTELSADLKSIKKGGVNKQLFERDSTETGLLEGSRMIKYNGKYYLLMISWPKDKPRRQVCFRADNILGPYEKKVILESQFAGFPYAGQGTIVDDEKGNWYGVIFQDRGGVGRVLTLNPCRWIDGWPMLGDRNGHIPAEVNLPFSPDLTPGDGVAGSDDFSAPNLRLFWEWNHNPVDNAWSLKERQGWLRLHTANITDNFFAARNTISQRLVGPVDTVTVKLDVKGLKEGDCTGLAAMQGDAAMLLVRKTNGKFRLELSLQSVHMDDEKSKAITKVDQQTEQQVSFSGHIIYLRMITDFRAGHDYAQFLYSTDNKRWKTLGKPFKMVYDYRRLFMGTRAAIYCYATKQQGGHVDVDWYHSKW